MYINTLQFNAEETIICKESICTFRTALQLVGSILHTSYVAILCRCHIAPS